MLFSGLTTDHAIFIARQPRTLRRIVKKYLHKNVQCFLPRNRRLLARPIKSLPDTGESGKSTRQQILDPFQETGSVPEHVNPETDRYSKRMHWYYETLP
jgi:hypothetical protein